MPNIAQALKQEMSRISRKEIRAETQPLKAATARYRSDIAALKRQISALERHLKKTAKALGEQQQEEPEDQSKPSLRFSATRFASHRQRLGLSAREMGQLIGVSALSVYKWESGKARPRARQLEAIAAVRRLGKREAAERLLSI